MWADAARGYIECSCEDLHTHTQQMQRRVGWYRFGSTGTSTNSIAQSAHTNVIELRT